MARKIKEKVASTEQRKNKKAEFVLWMGPLLDALRELGDSGSPHEVSDLIAKNQNISDEKKEEILLGENKFKLTRVVTKCIAYGGLMLIHPALAAIAFLGKLARDHRVDIKERDKIVNEMNHELTLVREKIKDADSKGDNKEKYALMRIVNKLQTEISRIKFRTD